MWSFLKPEPHRPLLSKEKIDPTYKRLRWQVFIGIFIGYAGYYLVRKNFSLAMPYLVDMGFDKGLLGVAISANAIAYGLSKFIMGGVSDRSSARKFLPLGLTLSALATLLLGTKVGVSSIVSMFILQFLIGWFQGMGWPPCGRVMTHWFSHIPDPKVERARPRSVLQGQVPSPVDPPPGCRFAGRCPYATDRCRAEKPELCDMGGGHRVACHLCR